MTEDDYPALLDALSRELAGVREHNRILSAENTALRSVGEKMEMQLLEYGRQLKAMRDYFEADKAHRDDVGISMRAIGMLLGKVEKRLSTTENSDSNT